MSGIAGIQRVMSGIVLSDGLEVRNRQGRGGRPPRERAGEVDARILAAAQKAFFEHGLAGASMDQIASLAGAGKPTIYSRFPNKEALFTAVVMRDIEHTVVTGIQNYTVTGDTIERRLTNLSSDLLQRILVGDTIGLLRLAVSEARRFPDLAGRVGGMARARGAEAVAPLLAEVVSTNETGPVPAFAPERLATTTRLFQELVLMPMVFRALMGEHLTVLRQEIAAHVARNVRFFLAGCRHGGIAD